ncbi:sigma-54 interaction domain-containing protein [Carboxydothermus pertinax]|uniref:Fis family transcriptional regulator n=1 Tax=Carboxydothermus pertinax TaxID=870242 RepID=A0A1L8CYC5_9THEO|nr:sigma 54-interacting transcriptional regulator [Carboxydothermus pertinax]GAV23897.1 Fis family transcriptional regulator [Carboxydothermus pertinax]
MRKAFVESLKETFGLVIELPEKCLSLISPPKTGYQIWTPPCTPTCLEGAGCPYSLILAFKLQEDVFWTAWPKEKTNNLTITTALLLKFLLTVMETIHAAEQKLDNSSTTDALQFLASHLETDFFLFNNKGQVILSQSRTPKPFSTSALWEKLSRTSEPEGFIETKGGNFYYRVFSKNGKMTGLLAWKTEPNRQEETESLLQNESLFTIPGKNPRFLEIKKLVRQIAVTDNTVLLQGESGTGKELFARYIHYLSPRKEQPFIAINCAAIPENLLESELFGYEDGSFTGARRGGKPGKFELANGGTIFLDEIGDMPTQLQAKLLRVLEERRVERIGATVSYPVDIRIIAATNKNLKELIDAKQFREDLFFRLNVFPVHIPPLRERRDDIPLLLDFYLKNICLEQDKPFKIFNPEAIQLLKDYNWPGNVRELKNVVAYAVSLCEGDVITPHYLPKYLQNGIFTSVSQFPAVKIRRPFNQNDQLKEQLEILLAEYGHSTQSKKLIAKELGVSLATLYRWLKKYRLK